MKTIRGMIASMICVLLEFSGRKSGQVEMERIGVPPKNYRHLYTIMDRGRELF